MFAGAQTLRDSLFSYHNDHHQVLATDLSEVKHLVERLSCYRPPPDVVEFFRQPSSLKYAKSVGQLFTHHIHSDDDPYSQYGQIEHRASEDFEISDDIPEQRSFIAYNLKSDVNEYLAQCQEVNRCLSEPCVPHGSAPDIDSTRRSVSALEVAQQPDMHAFVRLNIPSKCKICKRACYFHSVMCSKCNLACHTRCAEKLNVRTNVNAHAFAAILSCFITHFL